MTLKPFCTNKFLLKAPGWRQVMKRWFGQPVHQTHPYLMSEEDVTPGISKKEFFQRRSNLWQSISTDDNIMAIIPSSCKAYMAHEVPYPFRQNTDFLYLSGFQEPDSILLLTNLHSSNKRDFRSILFVPKRDVKRELWDGPRTGSARVADLTGVDEGYDVDEFTNVFNLLTKKQTSFHLYYNHIDPAHHKLHLDCLKSACDEATKVHAITRHIQQLKQLKSPSEQRLLRKSCSIASQALNKLMAFSQPAVEEAHLEALMDFECRLHGATRLAYPPVIAGGNRANTIHYIENNQRVMDGDVLLVDAGCEYHGYSSDITRSWPVNGHFSKAQRALYEALLEVQETCVRLCTPKNLSLNQLHMIMLGLLGRQLQRLGIVASSASEAEVRKTTMDLCPHHIGHYLGMDVHDVDEMSRNTPLRASTVITIEPGIYIRKDNKCVPAEWRGVGIRIEDDVVVTESSGPEVLTKECVKHPMDVEAMVRIGRARRDGGGRGDVVCDG